MTAVFLGLTTLDIINYVSRYPTSNEKIKARLQLQLAGGPAANAAVACAALGSKPVLLTVLGKDAVSGIVRDDLEQHGVHPVNLMTSQGGRSVVSSVVVDESDGSRSVIYSAGEQPPLGVQHVAEDVWKLMQVLLVDGHYLPAALQVVQYARERGIPVVLDGGSWKQGLEKLLPLVNYAICSESFIPPECRNSVDVIDYLADCGIRHIAISRGARPLLVSIGGESTTLEVAAHSVAVDTLGAGDILHGAFCHYIIHTGFLVALRKATDIATLSCRFRGTRQWIDHF